jgi:hypothetical protein
MICVVLPVQHFFVGDSAETTARARRSFAFGCSANQRLTSGEGSRECKYQPVAPTLGAKGKGQPA